MDMEDAAKVVRAFDLIEKFIDLGRPDLAKENLQRLRTALLKDMSA